MSLGLFIFRQDLRTIDNTGLALAIEECDQVIPLFVFDTKVFSRFPKDDKRLGFQWEALEELESEINTLGGKLHVCHGNAEEVILDVLEKHAIDAVYRNRSYGEGSVTRDKTISTYCEEKDIKHTACTDYLMLEIDVVETRKVFTPFFKKRLPIVQEESKKWKPTQSCGDFTTPVTTLPVLADQKKHFSHFSHPHRSVKGIRKRLANLALTEYELTRNLPANTEGTTKLSPYLTFGVVGPREAYRLFVNHMSVSSGFPKEKNWADVIVSELAWREFWQHISYRFPETTYDTYLEFQDKRKTIVRDNNKDHYEARKNGTTGYPIVDAGMRQLKEENRMHNRVRMIVASFLTKDLLIDRRRGEKHFADLLIDYDRNVNIGNRQRSASVGADPKPLRIFSPILQAKRFDPLAKYILKRVPELEGQPIAAIQDPTKYVLDYHPPIVNHYEWSRLAKTRYNESKQRYIDGVESI